MKLLISFLLTILVINISSCKKDDSTNNVTPKADFEIYENSSGGTCTITNRSTGADSYSWDFGNGRTSDEKEPSVTYSRNGFYIVNLTAKNSNGKSSTITKSISIRKIRGSMIFWTNSRTAGGSYIKIYVNNIYYGDITRYANSIPDCFTNYFVTVVLPAGFYNLKGVGEDGTQWNYVVEILESKCSSFNLY